VAYNVPRILYVDVAALAVLRDASTVPLLRRRCRDHSAAAPPLSAVQCLPAHRDFTPGIVSSFGFRGIPSLL